MEYTREEFFRLLDIVESQGGTYLDKTHEHDYYTELTGGPVEDVQQQFVRNCGENALFTVPYEGGELEVCAKDDMMGLWPRFSASGGQAVAV